MAVMGAKPAPPLCIIATRPARLSAASNAGGSGLEWTPGPVVWAEDATHWLDAYLVRPWRNTNDPMRTEDEHEVCKTVENLALALRDPRPCSVLITETPRHMEWQHSGVRSLLAERAAFQCGGDSIVPSEAWKIAARRSGEIRLQRWLPWRGPRRRASALVVLRSPTSSSRADRPGMVKKGPVRLLEKALALSGFRPADVAWCWSHSDAGDLTQLEVRQADLAGPVLAAGKRVQQYLSGIGVQSTLLPAFVRVTLADLENAVRLVDREPPTFSEALKGRERTRAEKAAFRTRGI